MAAYLGDKPFFMGSAPAGIDATMFAFAVSDLSAVRVGSARAAQAMPICAGMSAG